MPLIIFQQILFFISLPLLLFLPGYLVLRFIPKLSRKFNIIEWILFSIALSIGIVNFLMLLMGRLNIPITRTSLVMFFGAFIIGLGARLHHITKLKKSKFELNALPIFSPAHKRLVFTLVLITLLIKLFYLSGSIIPTSTDLGHHMYWSNTIVTDGVIPIYEKTDIDPNNNKIFTTPIADFIIGEHLIFAAISLISGVSVISAFPVLLLFFLHLCTIAALMMFVLRLFENYKHVQTFALLTLFVTGPLFALSSPQMKFISGGVIGNTIGNLFIPILLVAFYRALKDKDALMLSLALFLSITLAYTHHLSTFVFIFIAFFSFLFYCAISFKSLHKEFIAWFKLVINPRVLGVIISGILFVLFIYTPTYLNVKAVDTAVGTPSKSTRVGFTFTQLAETAGDARFALGILGLAMLFVFRKKFDSFSSAFLGGWTFSLLIMSLKPQWLLIDIPSNRIASYIIFPISILAAFFISTLLSLRSTEGKEKAIKPFYISICTLLALIFLTQSGTYDNAQATSIDPNATNEVLQVHHAAKYLASKTNVSDIILKDHNYLPADSWIKLFFMRGYNYPFSRAYFKRYEDTTKQREMCTYYMITTPNTPQANACFKGTRTNFLMVNPKYDDAQFKRNDNFSHVYASDIVSIYFRPN